MGVVSILSHQVKRSTDSVMIVYRQKMLFILPQTPPETTGRSFLLACKALYMKISGSPGEKVVFWAVVPPPNCIVYILNGI